MQVNHDALQLIKKGIDYAQIKTADPQIDDRMISSIIDSLHRSNVIERTAEALGYNLGVSDFNHISLTVLSKKGCNRAIFKVTCNTKVGNQFIFVLKFPRAFNPKEGNAINHAVLSNKLGLLFQKDTGVICATLEDNPKFFITGPFYNGYCADQILTGDIIEKTPGNTVKLSLLEFLNTWKKTSNNPNITIGGKNIEPTLGQIIIDGNQAHLIDKGHYAIKANIVFSPVYDTERKHVDFEITTKEGSKIDYKDTSQWLEEQSFAHAFFGFYGYLARDICKSIEDQKPKASFMQDDPDGAALAYVSSRQSNPSIKDCSFKPIEGMIEGLKSFLAQHAKEDARILIQNLINDSTWELGGYKNDVDSQFLLNLIKSEIIPLYTDH